jgi:hypothetical protein
MRVYPWRSDLQRGFGNFTAFSGASTARRRRSTAFSGNFTRDTETSLLSLVSPLLAAVASLLSLVTSLRIWKLH